MTEHKLAEELLALRRQIARLKSREAQIELVLRRDDRAQPLPRPGWPIRRLEPGAGLMA